jgi:hypothetical protein
LYVMHGGLYTTISALYSDDARLVAFCVADTYLGRTTAVLRSFGSESLQPTMARVWSAAPVQDRSKRSSSSYGQHQTIKLVIRSTRVDGTSKRKR